MKIGGRVENKLVVNANLTELICVVLFSEVWLAMFWLSYLHSILCIPMRTNLITLTNCTTLYSTVYIMYISFITRMRVVLTDDWGAIEEVLYCWMQWNKMGGTLQQLDMV